MGKIVKYATDMTDMFSKKVDPTRVGTRYDKSKDIAGRKYAANGLAARTVIETVRGILSENDVPPGKWGVHIAFALKLWKIATTFITKVPSNIVDGFIKEYTLKGADPAILDKISGLIVGR
jgi:hypothetical protein